MPCNAYLVLATAGSVNTKTREVGPPGGVGGVSGGTEETPITTLRSGISCPRKGMAEGGRTTEAEGAARLPLPIVPTPLSDARRCLSTGLIRGAVHLWTDDTTSAIPYPERRGWLWSLFFG